MAYGMGTERAAEAVELIQRARRLNPLTPAWQLHSLGYASYFASHYEQAIEALEQSAAPSLELKVIKALTYAQLGRQGPRGRGNPEGKARLHRPGLDCQRHHGARRQLGDAVPRRRAQGRLPIDEPGPTH
jgi:hypothetical protein